MNNFKTMKELKSFRCNKQPKLNEKIKQETNSISETINPTTKKTKKKVINNDR